MIKIRLMEKSNVYIFLKKKNLLMEIFLDFKNARKLNLCYQTRGDNEHNNSHLNCAILIVQF